MSDFHQWRATMVRFEVCDQCHVVAPTGSLRHRPLPIFCPGEVGPAHVFDGDQARLICTRCGLVVPKGTMPNEMDWVCKSPWQVG